VQNGTRHDDTKIDRHALSTTASDKRPLWLPSPHSISWQSRRSLGFCRRRYELSVKASSYCCLLNSDDETITVSLHLTRVHLGDPARRHSWLLYDDVQQGDGQSAARRRTTDLHGRRVGVVLLACHRPRGRTETTDLHGRRVDVVPPACHRPRGRTETTDLHGRRVDVVLLACHRPRGRTETTDLHGRRVDVVPPACHRPRGRTETTDLHGRRVDVVPPACHRPRGRTETTDLHGRRVDVVPPACHRSRGRTETTDLHGRQVDVVLLACHRPRGRTETTDLHGRRVDVVLLASHRPRGGRCHRRRSDASPSWARDTPCRRASVRPVLACISSAARRSRLTTGPAQWRRSPVRTAVGTVSPWPADRRRSTVDTRHPESLTTTITRHRRDDTLRYVVERRTTSTPAERQARAMQLKIRSNTVSSSALSRDRFSKSNDSLLWDKHSLQDFLECC